MTTQRYPGRPFLGSGLIFLLASVSLAASAEDRWPTTRTSVPTTVEDLKSLEAQVKKVVAKTTPETVGLMVVEGEKQAAGSGVIVSPDGLILTAGHVSGEPGTECKVRFSDGTKADGISLGRNKFLDSGMIQLQGKGPNNGKWPFAEMAKALDLKEGQWVVTLGHPGGFRENRPPVARLGRVLTNDDRRLRTNCTIVGGDSGGPLFDLDGKLVGIHSRIGWSLTENVHVPIDAFVKDWDRLKAGDDITRTKTLLSKAILGVEFDEESKVARIAKVSEDFPAEKAGLKSGDVIVKFAGLPVKSADAVRTLIGKKKPGDEVTLVIEREGKSMTFKLKLAARGS